MFHATTEVFFLGRQMQKKNTKTEKASHQLTLKLGAFRQSKNAKTASF